MRGDYWRYFTKNAVTVTVEKSEFCRWCQRLFLAIYRFVCCAVEVFFFFFYKTCTRRVWSLIGDSHDGQIDVCRLVAMVIWSWTSNVVNRGQNVPVGSTPTDTIGPRSRSRLSPRYVLVVLKWRKNRSTFKARRVYSFDFVQSDSFLCQPTDEHNRETFACESDHSRLATIIVDVPMAVENLPVVWMAYKETFLQKEHWLVKISFKS